MIPYKPIRVTKNVPEYSSSDIEIYGLPDHYGVQDYLIIESYEKQMVLEYQDEIDLARDGVYIHRYDRIERFTTILFQLLGLSRVSIPDDVIRVIKNSMYREHASYIYNDIRDILRRYGYAKYYNRIPCILKILKFPLQIKYKQEMIFAVQRDFKKLHETFEETKKELDVDYFPSMRYVALYLMERNGFLFEYHIPKARVKKIHEKLDLLVGKLFLGFDK